MLTVIFGAGASHDSVDPELSPEMRFYVEPAPPLATQLFDDRRYHIDAMNRFNAMSSLVGQLRSAASSGGAAMEEALRAIQDQAVGFPPLQRALLAIRYYLRDVCGDPITRWREAAGRATNYSALVGQVAEWAHRSNQGLTLITFNYDTLLESAVRDVFDRRMQDLSHYIEDESCVVLKPHGSVDWVEFIEAKDGRYELTFDTNQEQLTISHAPNITPTGTYAHRSRARGMSIPAVAIPVDQSKTFVCPDAHLEVMRNRLSETDRVLIIGWRASERHFMEELREHCKAKRVGIVDYDYRTAGDVLENLRDQHPTLGGRDAAVAAFSGFSQFIRAGNLRRWLTGQRLVEGSHVFGGD